MKMTGWAWDHAKYVADRCAERFESRTELKDLLHMAITSLRCGSNEQQRI